MDFEYSEEQTLLKDSLRRFIDGRYDFESRRKLLASSDGFSRDNWRQFAELGWLGVAFPEDSGGFAGSPVETMIIMEEFGRGLVVEPYLATVVLGGGLVEIAGSAAQKSEILEPMIAGELMLAFGHSEPQGRFNLADVRTTAEKDGDGYRLSGKKIVVYHAGVADRLIVSARTSGDVRDSDGITLFLVDPRADGVSIRDYRTVDGFRAGDITLEGVKVGADAVLGTVGGAHPAIEAVVDRAISALAAEAVGAMERANEITNDYLKSRKQFGVAIGKFQVLQHRMVDMYMHAEQAKSLSCMLAMKLDGPDRERALAAAATKARVGQAARFVGEQAVQLHGGMGMTEEYTVGHYMKRLTMIETLFGNVDHHLRRYAALAD
ncbi:acyl-CoA dehydrogenase family protein [Oceanibacterium hippocampi]|uniref:Acyl-CoA dehydrogenase n=1 Tax=Oceanibacterium hippocampi TaxID=745714 RepID=A0A1Y5S266_9PROT|nr:acyl-CoA dehydrogenase family protein [Oceanibacterium hippocampi]SLN29581.1 Acyl-CoA dehydrogenase [Oceanibacterium hippocampi]